MLQPCSPLYPCACNSRASLQVQTNRCMQTCSSRDSCRGALLATSALTCRLHGCGHWQQVEKLQSAFRWMRQGVCGRAIPLAAAWGRSCCAQPCHWLWDLHLAQEYFMTAASLKTPSCDVIPLLSSILNGELCRQGNTCCNSMSGIGPSTFVRPQLAVLHFALVGSLRRA